MMSETQVVAGAQQASCNELETVSLPRIQVTPDDARRVYRVQLNNYVLGIIPNKKTARKGATFLLPGSNTLSIRMRFFLEHNAFYGRWNDVSFSQRFMNGRADALRQLQKEFRSIAVLVGIMLAILLPVGLFQIGARWERALPASATLCAYIACLGIARAVANRAPVIAVRLVAWAALIGMVAIYVAMPPLFVGVVFIQIGTRLLPVLDALAIDAWGIRSLIARVRPWKGKPNYTIDLRDADIWLPCANCRQLVSCIHAPQGEECPLCRSKKRQPRTEHFTVQPPAN